MAELTLTGSRVPGYSKFDISQLWFFNHVQTPFSFFTGSYRFWCEDCKKGFNFIHHYNDHKAKHEGKNFTSTKPNH